MVKLMQPSVCDEKSAPIIPQKTILWYITRNYLTRNAPYILRIQKNQISGNYGVRIKNSDLESGIFKCQFTQFW